MTTTNNFTINLLNESTKIKEIISSCVDLLYCNEAKPYLEYLKNRLNKKAIKEFEFGLLPPNELLYLLSSKTISNLKELKLYNEWSINDQINSIDSYNFFKNHNVIMPIKDDFNNYVGITGRTILSEIERKAQNIDKYKNSFFTKSVILFGLNEAKYSIMTTKKVFLVEGQLDCITCHSNGFYNVVSLNGTTFGIFQLYLLKKYGGENLEICLLLDNDEPGNIAMDKIIKNMSKFAKITKIKVPNQFHDIDSYINTTNNFDLLI